MRSLPGRLFQYDSDARVSSKGCHITPVGELAVYPYDDIGQLRAFDSSLHGERFAFGVNKSAKDEALPRDHRTG
jgi:hypothetical protein